MKQILQVAKVTKAVLVIMIVCSASYAGNLQPPEGDPASTMVTLQEIYDKINTISILSKVSELPRTGQTTSYATGDDGDIQKGKELPTPRFTDNGNGTVTDNLTGLIWLKNANVAGGTRDWTTALSDVAQLNTDGTINGNDCGDTSNGGSHQTDWRLPNRFELESIINLGFNNPCISNTAGDGQWSADDPFTNVISGYYWSGTTYAGTADSAFRVSIYSGGAGSIDKSTTYYVWPVRGGSD